MDCNPTQTPAATQRLTKTEDHERESDKAQLSDYRKLIGSLRWLADATRPDISYAVGQVSRYVQDPGPDHWLAAKRILRYLKGTVEYGLCYRRSTDGLRVQGYSDADWAGDTDDRRSYLFPLRKSGCQP